MNENPRSVDAPPPTVWPTFNYEDAPAAIRFLTEVLGFEVALVVPDDADPRRIVHAELAWPEGGGVMLGSSGRDDSEFSTLPNGGCYVVTDHVHAVHGRAVAAGATIVRGLEATGYAGDQFTVADPENVHWCFGDYRGTRPSRCVET